jgi:hypothetical protein
VFGVWRFVGWERDVARLLRRTIYRIVYLGRDTRGFPWGRHLAVREVFWGVVLRGYEGRMYWRYVAMTRGLSTDMYTFPR